MSVPACMKYLAFAGLAVGLTTPRPSRADDWKILVNSDNSFGFRVLHGDDAVLNLNTVGWGPNWAWFAIGSDQKATGDELSIAAPVEIGALQRPLDVEPLRLAGSRRD